MTEKHSVQKEEQGLPLVGVQGEKSSRFPDMVISVFSFMDFVLSLCMIYNSK